MWKQAISDMAMWWYHSVVCGRHSDAHLKCNGLFLMNFYTKVHILYSVVSNANFSSIERVRVPVFEYFRAQTVKHYRALDIRTLSEHERTKSDNFELWASTNAHFSERKRASIEQFEVQHNTNNITLTIEWVRAPVFEYFRAQISPSIRYLNIFIT